MSDATLLVMAKAPTPGTVKTRMTRGPHALSMDDAARFQGAFIRDIAERDFPWAARRRLWTRGSTDAPVWADAEAQGWALRRQLADDLGQNLEAAFADAFAASDAPAVVLGTDSPDLPDELLARAFSSAKTSDVVLGPSFDGGYYLLGLRHVRPELFAEIAWGTEAVFASTLERANSLGLTTHVLPFWYDADEVADLRRLRVHSRLTTGGMRAHYAARTLALIHELGISPHGHKV